MQQITFSLTKACWMLLLSGNTWKLKRCSSHIHLFITWEYFVTIISIIKLEFWKYKKKMCLKWSHSKVGQCQNISFKQSCWFLKKRRRKSSLLKYILQLSNSQILLCNPYRFWKQLNKHKRHHQTLRKYCGCFCGNKHYEERSEWTKQQRPCHLKQNLPCQTFTF